MQPFAVCVLLLLFLAAPACADWPEFRGPGKQGHSAADLPTHWSAEEHLRWRSELPGQGWSSPIVVGQTIYLTAAIESLGEQDQGYQLVALIVDGQSGEIVKQIPLFKQDESSPKIHQKNSHASPTPVFDGEHIFIHFGHQGTACITPQGQVVWKNDDLFYPPVHGNGGSPVVVDDVLIFSRDGGNIGEVTALDKRSGKVVWQTVRDVDAKKQFSFCTPLVLEQGGRRQLILPGSNVVQSLDPANGRELWRVTYEGYSVIPRPIFESGLIFVCTGYDRPTLLAIDPSGSGDVTATHVKWQTAAAVAHTPSLIGKQGKVITVSDSGIATCFDATTGKEIWKERIGGNFSASPILVGDCLYLLSEQGDCSVLDISGGSPKSLAKNAIGERCLASLAVIDNDLLLRSDQALYRISKQAQ